MIALLSEQLISVIYLEVGKVIMISVNFRRQRFEII